MKNKEEVELNICVVALVMTNIKHLSEQSKLESLE